MPAGLEGIKARKILAATTMQVTLYFNDTP
jgi:hypothetical protein